jgi:hypothetical protein
MTHAETLRRSYVSLEVNAQFTEAVLRMRDGSRLCFCHRVGERWAKAVGPEGAEPEEAGAVLSRVSLFRLNGKHLDIQFEDGSRWEARFRGSGERPL